MSAATCRSCATSPIDESRNALQDRLLLLDQQLDDPLTAANAALRLEAIGGDEAIEILKKALKSNDPEVRFYAAEALAYLDETAAVDPLADVARDEPAFRVNALAALSAMDDVMAYDALRSLLEVKSAETRYGAFRALWAMNEHDPLVRGENLGDQFHYHVLDVAGAGHDPRHAAAIGRKSCCSARSSSFDLPLVLDAGKNILVNGQSGGKITVSRFTPAAEPQQRIVSTQRRRSRFARSSTSAARIPTWCRRSSRPSTTARSPAASEVDALPEPGRQYDREAAQYESEDERRATGIAESTRLAARRRDAAAGFVHANSAQESRVESRRVQRCRALDPSRLSTSASTLDSSHAQGARTHRLQELCRSHSVRVSARHHGRRRTQRLAASRTSSTP